MEIAVLVGATRVTNRPVVLANRMESEIPSYRGFAAQSTEHIVERMIATANAQRLVFDISFDGIAGEAKNE